MHLDDGTLQALLDGELDSVAGQPVWEHLDECDECRARLEWLREGDALLDRVLPALDHQAASPAVGQVMAQADRMRGHQYRLRWAAVLALMVCGAGALYAVPGSPLRRWIDRIVGRGGRTPAGETRAGTTAGLALKPGDRFHITFAATAPGSGSVSIRLTEDSVIDVRSVDGSARFVAEIDGLRIEPTSARADFVIGIPQRAPSVEVLVQGESLFLKEGSRIIAKSRPDSLGSYVMTLSFD